MKRTEKNCFFTFLFSTFAAMKRLLVFLAALLCSTVLSAQQQDDTVFVNTAYCDGKPIAMTFRYMKKGSLEWITVGDGQYGSTAIDTATRARVIVIPDSVMCPLGFRVAVTSIGRHAFGNCTHISEVRLPAGLEEIGDQAFHNCLSLAEVVMPPTLKVIWPFAFRGCHGLNIIRMLGHKRPAVYDNIFDQQTLDNATLIVPAGYMDKYVNSLVFGMFRYCVEAFE